MCIRQISAIGGGGNRTFAFLGRILVPAAVFLAFLEGIIGLLHLGEEY